VALASPSRWRHALAAALARPRGGGPPALAPALELLLHVRERIWSEQEKLAQLICAEAGKPIHTGRAAKCSAGWRPCCSPPRKRGGLTREYLPPRHRARRRELPRLRAPRAARSGHHPLAFNFPLNLLLHKLAALARGLPRADCARLQLRAPAT